MESGERSEMSASLSRRLTGVFNKPGEVFESLKGVDVNAINWVVPLTIVIMVSVIASFIVFSREDISQEIRKAQETEVEKFELPPAQKAELQKVMDKVITPELTMIAALIGVVFGTPINWVVYAFLFHWIVRIASRNYIPFVKCFEVIALSNIVNVLGIFVNMFLVIIKGKLYTTLSLALIFNDFDAGNPMHALAKEIDVFRIWHLGILSVAWSRLTQHPIPSCINWIFGVWIAFVILKIALLT